MSDPFIGEIKMFAGNFAPRGWALCDGRLLTISQNDALFSLFGTIYGGDGRTTFGLPDLRGRVPVHAGDGPGLTPRRLGAKGGVENVTLSTVQIPSHVHTVDISQTATPTAVSTLKYAANGANQASPTGNALATARGGEERFSTAPVDGGLHADSVILGGKTESIGGSFSHTNMSPFLCVNFIVALFGVYPSRA